MLLPRLLMLGLLVISVQSMFCNYYPMDAKACIQKTDGVMCLFSQFENACLDASLTSYGCVPTLNKMACLNQLTDSDDQEASCIFNSKCLQAKKQHFKNLGCSDKYSKYACMNVIGKDCYWNNGCLEYSDNIPLKENCEQVFTSSVTPSLCQQIQDIYCMNSGFNGDYKCVNITDQQLSTILCSQQGLNELGCRELTTTNQACIFENYQCQSILPNQPKQCNLKLNRLGCLQIIDPNLKCQWQNQQCVNFTQDSLECNDIYEVNPSVCSGYDGVCLYDSNLRKCVNPTAAQLEKINCNTFGLTKQACLQIKNQYCTFFRGICEQLSKDDLNLYQCNMLLNQDACVNIKTEFQYCQWDGNQCSRITLSQNIDCPIVTDNTNAIFNGKVCQAISKPGVMCKYNTSTNLCERSTQMDYCDSPFLNLQGCVSITRAGTSCQWTKDGCINIKIVANKTTCSSLGFANTIACSQVYENINLGCYYEPNLQQCKSIVISDEEDFLDTVKCSDNTYGLNKSICASITTTGQVCRWYQNQCQQIRSKEQIAQVQCISLQFVNQYACGLVEYGAEPCRYDKTQKGCINSFKSNMYCNETGLNSYACAIAKGSCYFDYANNLCKYVATVGADTSVTADLLNTMKCTSSSPTQDICALITTEGQLCSWSQRTSRCQNQYIPPNSVCATFAGTDVYVNANVCAAIINDFPDYDVTQSDPRVDANRGYCKFNPKTSQCQVNTDSCSTPCCSETDKIGINAHSCGKYSSQNAAIFCFFGNNLRCQQLTADQVGVVNKDTASIFYNANQLTCSQMTKNSCYMLNWSTKQRCYYNGSSCINVNFNNYKDLSIFTKAPSILNEYACLSIESTKTDINLNNYFEYDSSLHRCKAVTPTDAKCQDVKGNRNICLSYTSKVYCRWDTSLLKCVSMTDDEFESITTCNYNQNKKACIENPNIACHFLNNIDRCIVPSFETSCTTFSKDFGNVSSKVCASVTKDKEMCKYDKDNHQCVTMTDSITGCNVDGGNSIACYYLTSKNCIWDNATLICYEYLGNISNLGCNDNVNKNICLNITKEACVWNASKYKCQKLEAFDTNSYAALQSAGSEFNKQTCVQLLGGAYYFNIIKDDDKHTQTYTCSVLSDTIDSCNKYAMNKQACLTQTRGLNCYFDPLESNINNRCKTFTDDQTSCSSNTLINIEVCMKIPKQCFFSYSTLTCTSTTIKDNVLCSDLRAAAAINIYYNQLSCAAISVLLTQSDGATQCNDDTDDTKTQTCNYEKYCAWVSSTYTCDILKMQSIGMDTTQTKQECKDVTTTGDDGTETTTKQCTDVPDPKCKNKKSDVAKYPQDCSRLYSKAICLEMSNMDCYFDLNQGGCNPLRQDKLPSCDSVSQICRGDPESPTCTNNCSVSQTKNALCKLSSIDNTFPTDCPTLQQTITYCVVDTKLLATYKCEDYKTAGVAPSVCSKATNICYYDSSTSKCSSIYTKTDSGCSIECDNSFSQALCKECKCTFESGFCQKTLQAPKLLDDGSNLQFLCYEVNLLTKSTSAEKLCGIVQYSCVYTTQCDDATGYTCLQIGSSTVTQRACVRCIGGYKLYDSTNYKCLSIKDKVTSCTNLNKAACLYYSSTVNCRWNNYVCESFSSMSDNDSKDCTIYNTYSCLSVDSTCWVHPTTNLCSVFDETIGTCDSYKTQTHCLLSNTQQCYWNSGCTQVIDSTSYTCSIANKFGCLNMTTKKCGWSSTNQACYSLDTLNTTINDCSIVISDDDNTNSIDMFNAAVCSSLIINTQDNNTNPQSCFLDNYFKCRSPIPIDILTCTTTGLNQYACLNSTTGSCKYLNQQCQVELSTELECSSNLNIQACLNQQKTCKYAENGCQSFTINAITNIINDTDDFYYSISVCTSLDSSTDQSLIYNSYNKRCLNISGRSPYLNSCNVIGINKNACLQKTTVLCAYQNNQCISITKSQLSQTSTCDPTLNWYACSNLKSKCQFVNGKCQNISDTDTCQSLSTNQAIVNYNVCSTRLDKACKLDSTINQCIIVDSSQLCTATGLNQLGCQFQTSGSLCSFSGGQCSNNYTDQNCTDIVNEDKCLAIRTKLQYCYFDSTLGCKNFSATEDFTKCGTYSKATYSPLVCSLATDKACFYDKTANICKEYKSEDAATDPDNYDWSNNQSFNALACQQFTSDDQLLTYWNQGCLEIPEQQLQYLKCEEQVNLYGCINITTPGEYCMYKDNKCTKVTNLTGNCADYVNINSNVFCSHSTNTACYYNSSYNRCDEMSESDTLDCSSNQGYNQLACQKDTTNCIFYNSRCFQQVQTTKDPKLFCSDAQNQADCRVIPNEGCQFINNVCSKVTDYSSLNCQDVINEYGCLRVSKIDQYCLFVDDGPTPVCKLVNPITIKEKKCEDIGNVNSFVYCEQVSDTECKYDAKQLSCTITASTEEFGCNKGLNSLACLTQTTKSLQCKFLTYCYGPNYQIMNCDSNNSDCCTLASNVESCLFQNKYNCLYNNEVCQKYTLTELKCDMIQKASINICTSIVDSFCVFDIAKLQCKSIQPTTCDQAQTQLQCRKIDGISCYWNPSADQCEYKQKQNYDECQDIYNTSGNKRACMDVERAGQLCQFKDFACQTFIEVDGNNCLDNINKVACTQQTISDCIWIVDIVSVQWSSFSDLTSSSVGNCQTFNAFDKTQCGDYLSYSSCLKITTLGSQCIWMDEQCQQIQINKNITISPNTLVLINSNACSLVNNGDMVRYNIDTLSCKKETDFDNLTCQPMTPGLNKQACLKNTKQKCGWDDKNQTCIYKGSRMLVQEKLGRLLQVQSCKMDGLGPQLCSQLTYNLPCGSTEIGCDQIDVTQVTCDYKGLNKYGCLNLTTGPCAWMQNSDGSYNCQSYIPFADCNSTFKDVNTIVCSYVQDDACVHNKQTYTCITPQENYTKCEIDGINAVACSQIDGCIFTYQKCQKADVNYNYQCADLEQANYKVCSLAIDRCKYSELTHGCVKSTITDNCNTVGLSALGCNVLDQCKWGETSCLCLSYLSTFPVCSTLQDYTKCVNIDYCYFEISKSIANKDLTQYLKNTNYGICRDKTCADLDLNRCQGTFINNILCYLNSQSKCLQATKCEEIIGSSIDCSSFKFNNIQCKTKNDVNECEILNCLSLNQTTCEQFQTSCVYTGHCKARTCEYMTQTQCQQNDCDWDDQLQKCTTQLDCSQITTSDKCQLKKEKGTQCAWIATLNKVEECTSTGCRYLGISQGDCMGTHIGTDVCVQMNDFSCVACEEVKDSCICLNQSQFCSYDPLTAKCKSKSCQHHNQDDCPITHCRFSTTSKICQPLCQYNYNQVQCNQADECVWDQTNKICVTHLAEIIIPQISLPEPNSILILEIALVFLISISL